MSSDLNVIVRKTDALLRLWQRYPYRHNLSCLSLGISFSCLCKSVDLCTDATSLFLIGSASHTHCLSVFPVASSLSPPLRFAYKPLANLFVLSLSTIKSSLLFHSNGWTQYYAKHGFSECHYAECRFVESRGTIKRQKNIVGYAVFTFILQFYYTNLQVLRCRKFAQTS